MSKNAKRRTSSFAIWMFVILVMILSFLFEDEVTKITKGNVNNTLPSYAMTTDIDF